MTENEISRKVLDAAIKVHHALGPGILEKLMRNVYFMS
jgi:hypothetical protein